MPQQTITSLQQSPASERMPVEAVPIIDFASFLSGDLAARKQVARVLGDACRDIGFFYLAKHGVAEELLDRVFAEARRFFALPQAEKDRIAIAKSPCHRGYFAPGGENLDPGRQIHAGDFKGGLKIGRDLSLDHPCVVAGIPLHGPNQWPVQLPGWRETMQAYFDALCALGKRLMHAFALALNLPERFFDDKLTLPMATLGPLHYPPRRGGVGERRIGAGAHTDFGCLTILAQDAVGGLQVRDSAGRWLDAPYIPGAFVVNIGDMMARWSNDLFRSTLHRVINVSGRDRYSIAFFYDPDSDAEVSCLATCCGSDNPPRYPPTTGGRYLLDRINATFDYRQTFD